MLNLRRNAELNFSLSIQRHNAKRLLERIITYGDWYRNYEDILLNDGKEQDKIRCLLLLKKVLLEAKLYKRDTKEFCVPSEIRKKLRPHIIAIFDAREILIQMLNDYFRYFSKDWDPDGTTDKLLRPDDLYDSTEWKIKLLKYLQSGEDVSTDPN